MLFFGQHKLTYKIQLNENIAHPNNMAKFWRFLPDIKRYKLISANLALLQRTIITVSLDLRPHFHCKICLYFFSF